MLGYSNLLKTLFKDILYSSLYLEIVDTFAYISLLFWWMVTPESQIPLNKSLFQFPTPNRITSNIFRQSLQKCLYNLLNLKEGNMKMPMRMVEHWMFLSSNLNTILTVFRTGFVLSLSYFLVSIALYRDIKKLIVSWHDFGKSILIRCQHLTNLLDNVMLTTENLGGCPNIRTTKMN